MVAAIGIPGRSGELVLHRSDVSAIKEDPTCRSLGRKLARIWDRIKDWFCNTKVAEAKKQLSVMYDPNSSSLDKLESFLHLKSLVGPAYADRFVEKSEPFDFSIHVRFPEGLEPYAHSVCVINREHLAETLSQEVAAAASNDGVRSKNQRELARDLPRADYFVDDTPLGELPCSHDQSDFDKFTNAISRRLAGTPQQLIAIETFAFQKLQGLIREAAWSRYGGLFGDDIGYTAGKGRSVYSLTRKGDDIELQAATPMQWINETEGAPPSCLFRVPNMTATVRIAPDGNVTVASAAYCNSGASMNEDAKSRTHLVPT